MREELSVRTGFTAACLQQRRTNFRSNHVEKAAFAEKHSKAAQRVIILDSSHQQGAAKFFLSQGQASEPLSPCKEFQSCWR